MKLSATVGRRRQDHHGDSCAAGGTGSLRRLRVRAAIARELRFSFRHLFDSHH